MQAKLRLVGRDAQSESDHQSPDGADELPTSDDNCREELKQFLRELLQSPEWLMIADEKLSPLDMSSVWKIAGAPIGYGSGRVGDPIVRVLQKTIQDGDDHWFDRRHERFGPGGHAIYAWVLDRFCHVQMQSGLRIETVAQIEKSPRLLAILMTAEMIALFFLRGDDVDRLPDSAV